MAKKHSILIILLLLIFAGGRGALRASALTTIPIPSPDTTKAPGATGIPITIDEGIETYVEMTPVEDKQISEIGYDEAAQILYIRFLSNGSLYLYMNFPPEEWEVFRTSRSINGFFNGSISGFYN